MAGFGAQLAPVAKQLIGQFGDKLTVTCRRYTQSGSVAAGKKSRTLAATVPGVLAVIVSENIFEIEGWKAGDEVAIMAADQFTSESLDTGWTIQRAGESERPVVGPIVRVKPGADTVYYQAHIRSGATGGR